METCSLGKKKYILIFVYERLDRSIATKDWASIYPNAFEIHGRFICSDHRPIIVSSNLMQERQKASPSDFSTLGANTNNYNTLGAKLEEQFQRNQHVQFW